MLHKDDNEPVPPATTAHTFPFAKPQFELVADTAAVNAAGSVNVNVNTVVHALFEVIVTVCGPANKLFTGFPDCKPEPHKNVVVPAPPK